MASISLNEYFPKKSPKFVPTTYIDNLIKDVYLHMIGYLEHNDRICLALVNKDWRLITEDEFNDAKKCEENNMVENSWYDNYEPYDRWDYEYGNACDDFTVYDHDYNCDYDYE